MKWGVNGERGSHAEGDMQKGTREYIRNYKRGVRGGEWKVMRVISAVVVVATPQDRLRLSVQCS